VPGLSSPAPPSLPGAHRLVVVLLAIILLLLIAIVDVDGSGGVVADDADGTCIEAENDCASVVFSIDTAVPIGVC